MAQDWENLHFTRKKCLQVNYGQLAALLGCQSSTNVALAKIYHDESFPQQGFQLLELCYVGQFEPILYRFNTLGQSR